MRFEKLIKQAKNIEVNNFSIDADKINHGVIFMYSCWSPSHVQMKTLIDSLYDFPTISLYVYDIDEEKFFDFKTRNNLYSDGWGETFWIKNGGTIAELKKYDDKNWEDLVRNNSRVLN